MLKSWIASIISDCSGSHCGTFTSISPVRADNWPPQIAPINAAPEGQTYGRWAAAWWQWALGIPAAENPLTDPSGENCAQRQVDEVWFLAGSQIGPVIRTCRIPAWKSLFFPLINTFYGAFLNDPPETRTEGFVGRAGRCTSPVKISQLSIDGWKVPQPFRVTGASGSQSPIFNIQLPPPGNLFGVDEGTVPELVLSPSAEQGSCLFVYPLSSGRHTIHWEASGCVSGNVEDITYHLTVATAPALGSKRPEGSRAPLLRRLLQRAHCGAHLHLIGVASGDLCVGEEIAAAHLGVDLRLVDTGRHGAVLGEVRGRRAIGGAGCERSSGRSAPDSRIHGRWFRPCSRSRPGLGDGEIAFRIVLCRKTTYVFKVHNLGSRYRIACRPPS